MFHVAVAGALSREPGIIEQLNDYLARIQAGMGAAEKDGGLRLIVSPAYASAEWIEWIRDSGCGATGYLSADDAHWEGALDRVVRVETALRDTLGDALCNRADLLLAVWDEDVLEQGGATWELLRTALAKRLPCVWISSRTGRVYWQERTVYDTFEPDKLDKAVRALNAESPDDAVRVPSPSPLLKAGRYFYKRFLGKYRAAHRRIDAKEDILLRDDYHLALEPSGAEACRRRLLEEYHRYDRAAIECNDFYQTALYWRAVLPLVTSVFIAVGFYATGVFAVLPGLSKQAWGFAAGIGFLVHGFLNLYVFSLSRSPKVKAYQRGMVKNRQMAELLRVLIHFLPFGIYPDLRRLCGEDRQLYAALRRLAWEAESQGAPRRIARENSVEAFSHAEKMLSDQIAYHRLSSERYTRVVAHLERWSRTVFYIGFIFILLRAALQFVMSLPGVPMPEYTLRNDIRLSGFISSFANLLALMMPAWYSFFSSKLSLCNFRFNRDNHQRMLALLCGEQDNFEHLQSTIDTAPAEALGAISEGLAEIMILKDTSIWVKQYEGTRIEHM